MKIHELLKKPINWTRFVDARDHDGSEVNPRSPAACRWCLLGAIQRCYRGTKRQQSVMNKIQDHLLGYGTVALFNDSKYTQHEDVLELCRRLDV